MECVSLEASHAMSWGDRIELLKDLFFGTIEEISLLSIMIKIFYGLKDTKIRGHQRTRQNTMNLEKMNLEKSGGGKGPYT